MARSATEVPTNATTSTATTGSAPQARDGMSASSTKPTARPRSHVVSSWARCSEACPPCAIRPGQAATNCSTLTTPITIRHSPSDRILAQLVRPLHQRRARPG